jgi:hypothetical protein
MTTRNKFLVQEAQQISTLIKIGNHAWSDLARFDARVRIRLESLVQSGK